MIISYVGPPDFGNETITIKIELQPSEVADVVRKLIGPGAVELVRDQLPPNPLVKPSTDDAIELLRRAGDCLSLTQIRKMQSITTDWCKRNGFAVIPSA